MADLTITAGNVATVSDATIVRDRLAGATITAGQAVYLDTSANTWKLADNDNTATTAAASGIALNGASSGQPLAVQTAGVINMGATVTVGTIYVLSSTAGGVCPTTDLGSGDYVTIIGVGVTAANIKLGFSVSGVQVPA